MSSELFKISILEPGIAGLAVSSEASPYLEERLAPSLREAIRELSLNSELKVLILHGGQKYFSGGASREFLTEADEKTMASSPHSEFPHLILNIPVPTVAAMAGHAIGGGLVLGLWCDLPVFASESLYGANFMALGFTPGMGATWVLEEAFGAALARELLFTGRLLKGREIAELGGLSHAVVPRAEVQGRALAIAREIAQNPREALQLLKQNFSAPRIRRLEEALKVELPMHEKLFARPQTRAEIQRRYARPEGKEGVS